MSTDKYLRLLDIPEIRHLEDKMVLEAWRPTKFPTWAQDSIDFATKSALFNTYSETRFKLQSDMSHLSEEEIGSLEDQHEAQFETMVLSDDEIVSFFISRGIDFRDDYGQPMKCTLFIVRQVEAAYKGIVGQIPEKSNAEAEVWGNSLEREAQIFQSHRRKG